MNPDLAYRLHTDWARAASRPGTNHHNWFTQRTKQSCTARKPETGEPGWRQFTTATDTVEAMRRVGPFTQVSFAVDYTPAVETDQVGLPGDVYAPLPQEPAAGSVTSDIIMVPEPVYTMGSLSSLASAPTYYVSTDMVTVMEVAAGAFDDFDTMPRLPAPSGFVVLARPIEVPDTFGTQLIHAFAWNRWGQTSTSLGVPGDVGDIWSFSSRMHPHESDPVVNEARKVWPSKSSWRNDPDLLPGYADRFLVGDPVGPLTEDVALARTKAQIVQEMRDSWKRRHDAEGDQVAPDPATWEAMLTTCQARIDQAVVRHRLQGSARIAGRMQPYLAAFILLLTQQITQAREERATDEAVRLAHKVTPHRPSQVTVVDVRRSTRRDLGASGEQTTGAESHRVLDHRHLVGSHWKWQPYGPQRALRRRIFVAGYVRGPEDKPLRVTPRVTRLS